MSTLSVVLTPLEKSLTSANFDRIILMIAATLSDWLCSKIMTLHKFTEFGGLQLETETRTILR